MGKAINELDNSGSITDATLVPVGETDTLKKTTWATIKSTLKTYFDSLYLAVTGGTIASGTKTASDPALTVTQTWNNAAVPFTGKLTNITDTASAAGSLIEDWQVGGVSKFSVTKNGLVTIANNLVAGDITLSPFGLMSGVDNNIGSTAGNVGFTSNYGGKFAWAFRSGTPNLQASSEAALGWTGTAAATNHSGPNGTVDAALGRSAAGVIEINNGTAGTFRDLKLRNLIASGGVVTLASFTVATLPSASTSGAGAQAFVTDSNATTYRATVAGGGSDKVTVTSDGSNWIITG